MEGHYSLANDIQPEIAKRKFIISVKNNSEVLLLGQFTEKGFIKTN